MGGFWVIKRNGESVVMKNQFIEKLLESNISVKCENYVNIFINFVTKLWEILSILVVGKDLNLSEWMKRFCKEA